MKSNNVHKGKLIDLERQKNYNIHIKKMNEISIRSKKNSESILNTSSTEKQQTKKNVSSKFINHSLTEKQRKINSENQRLMKKLYEIGHKKSGFNQQSKAEQQYYFINMKSRKMNRDIKEKIIQSENDLLVQRLVSKRRNVSPLFEEMGVQMSKQRRKKNRQKRSNSLILPKIIPPGIPELHS